MKKLIDVMHQPAGHWVGDGFPVRSIFSYNGDTRAISPFLLFDYAGPYDFEPNKASPRGVGQHPHKGFETVTIVFEGEVSHRDSAGGGGTIGPGDVQWMTAGAGIIHEEFHSTAYSKSGGPFRMVQLWVNLPSKDKLARPNYQAITTDQIPVVEFDGGKARVIAGALGDAEGPATTFTPINLWDVRLNAHGETYFDLPEGHNSMIAVLSGEIEIDGRIIGEAQIVRLSETGAGVNIKASADSMLLFMTGTPIEEPVFGYGPFVMNSRADIQQAINEFNSGQFGRMAPS